MPTIVGSKSGTRPYLELDWSVNRQDIANNRSSVNLKLYLKVDYSIGYSARYTGTLQGASFTSSSGYISKPGRYLLTQRNVWIGHNSNGSKTARLTADYNLNITWSGTYYGKISLSGDANLGTIPRASTMSAFSFGAHLKNGVANTIKYTVDRKSGSFRHQIQLKDGNTTLWTWDNQNTDGSNSITLSASRVNSLLNRMSNTTSKTFTLRIATRSGVGGGWIGSAVSMTARATVHADVKPTVGAVSVSQTGNSVSSHYLQGKSKVKASFTRSAGYGATISSSSITVRRKTTNNDVQTINSNSGTTGKAVNLTGTYQARGMARDSRGRTTYTAWKEFTVTAYSGPNIYTFSAVRTSATPTTVAVYRGANHTSLDGLNSARMLIEKRTGTGAWSTVEDTTASGGAWGQTVTSTGNSVSSSYEFRATLTDAFGEVATATVTVSTQRVVLDIHKNEGVGIGKIHEQGVLDVDGSAYFNGPIYIPHIVTRNLGHSGNFNDADRTSFYHMGSSADDNPSSTWGFLYSNTSATGGNSPATHVSQIFHERDGAQNMYSRSKTNGTWRSWKMISHVERGNNSNGHWVRFSDGTQICWLERSIGNNPFNTYGASSWSNINRTNNLQWTYPKSFTRTPATTGGANLSGSGSGSRRGSTVGFDGVGSTSASYQVFQIGHSKFTGTGYVSLMAIGRWK